MEEADDVSCHRNFPFYLAYSKNVLEDFSTKELENIFVDVNQKLKTLRRIIVETTLAYNMQMNSIPALKNMKWGLVYCNYNMKHNMMLSRETYCATSKIIAT